MANQGSPGQAGTHHAWDVYADEMRRYRRGERTSKPDAPWQHGAHIDSLPIEVNAPGTNLPSDVEETPGSDPLDENA